MAEEKPPSILHDLEEIRQGVRKAGIGVVDTAKALDTFAANGTSRLIGPAATQALQMTKSGFKRLGKVIWAHIAGDLHETEPQPEAEDVSQEEV